MAKLRSFTQAKNSRLPINRRAENFSSLWRAQSSSRTGIFHVINPYVLYFTLTISATLARVLNRPLLDCSTIVDTIVQQLLSRLFISQDSVKNCAMYQRYYTWSDFYTAQKMKFSIKNFFSKCDQIRRKLPIWSHLLKKSLIEKFIFVQCY